MSTDGVMARLNRALLRWREDELERMRGELPTPAYQWFTAKYGVTMDQRPFRALYEFTDAKGALCVIHEGEPQPRHWTRYYRDTDPLAAEVLRLSRRSSTDQR